MTCEICGGPLRKSNPYGACWKSGACRLEYRRRWSQTNPGAQDRRRARNRGSRHLEKAKYRAKEKGLPFSLTAADLPPIPDSCPALGVKLMQGTGAHAGNRVTLDRINPSLGYVPGNVQWLSHRANFMKSDASPEELIAFANWVIRTYS